MSWSTFDTVTGTGWIDHLQASDDDLDTCATGSADTYIYFGLTTSKYVSKIRFSVDDDNEPPLVSIDVDYGGGDWHTIYANQVNPREWTEFAVNHTISGIRYKDTQSANYCWVYEMQYEEGVGFNPAWAVKNNEVLE